MVQKVFIRFGKNWLGSQTMKVSEAIVDIVKAILSPSEIQAVESVLESLRSPQNEPWWNLFDEVHRSQFPSDILPQRLLGSGGDGFGIVLFQSNGQRGALASTTPPMYSTQGGTQNEVSYSTVREAVVNKFGDNAKT